MLVVNLYFPQSLLDYNKKIANTVKMGLLLNLQRLENFLKEAERRGMFSSIVVPFNAKYGLGIKDLDKSQLVDLGLKIEKNNKQICKENKKILKNENNNILMHGENKLFCHILPYFFAIYQLSFETLTLEDLSPLCDIFLLKDTQQLLFETFQLLMSSYSKKNISWKNEEQMFLKEQMQKFERNTTSYSWKKVSYQLFRFSDFKIYRSPRQCRQKWINHLDPNIVKSKWSLREDFQLLKVVKQYGMKWSLIARILNSGRTENMVKNRVVSIVKHACKNKSNKIKKGQIVIALKAIQRKIVLLNQTNVQNSQLNPEISNEIIKVQAPELQQVSENSGSETVCNFLEENILVKSQLDFRSPIILFSEPGEESWQYDESLIIPGPHHFFQVICSQSLF